jgi:hypothetical protein
MLAGQILVDDLHIPFEKVRLYPVVKEIVLEKYAAFRLTIPVSAKLQAARD